MALLKNFPLIYQLVPNHGYTKLMVHGVPCNCHANGTLPTSAELYHELSQNAHLKGWNMLDHPNWVKSAILDPGKTKLSFLFTLHNMDGKLN